ncbi:MAG: VIT1/CCC1 transporter family protein [Chloroflexi bacterium]|nr:VIT1/CCC1 transporter family protein [Chloroflexota bacterium]
MSLHSTDGDSGGGQPHTQSDAQLADERTPLAAIRTEKTRITSLGRVREFIFGMQDGLISTAILVSSVYGATSDSFVTIVAGLAGALGGMVSMSAGSLLASRAGKELKEAEIRSETRGISANPAGETEKMIEILQLEGLSAQDARLVTEKLATSTNAFVRTMVEKELGLSPDLDEVPWKDATVMGVSFLLGAAIPIVPYLIFDGRGVIVLSLVGTGIGLFAMGAGKTRITKRNPLRSGAEVFLIGVAAAILGYFLGSVIPAFFDTGQLP